MNQQRRQLLQSAAGVGLAAGLGDFGFLQSLPVLQAGDVPRQLAAVESDVEPLVRLIEDSPRERLLESVADRIRTGTSYQDLLSALMLAGVRGIQPRPVGFKFHAVLVVNSAHLASLAAQDRDRWLPLFWALDNFKSSQARNRQEGDWRMAPVGDVSSLTNASQRFREAMDRWQTESADRAIAAWTRQASLTDVYESFWRYGARDFRDIGHKAIFVANSYRTLQTIGWRHAEPIVRSLAYALLEHEGGNPADRDDDRDRPWRDNLGKAARIRADWQTGQISQEATDDLLATLRTANPAEASERVVHHLNAGKNPASLWDAIFLTSGELLMRQPGIVGLHTVTTMNALYFAYLTTGVAETRKMMLLQASSFLPMFRQAMVQRGQLRDVRVDRLQARAPSATGAEAVAEILLDISRDKNDAAAKTLSLLESSPASASALLAGARRMIFAKGTDSHDYKFSSAALEDFHHVTAAHRNRFLAASMFWLKGSGGNDTPLVQRTRAALQGT